MLLSAVIIGGLLVAAVQLFSNLGRSQQSITDQTAADLLALEMIQEIKQWPYADPAGPNNLGPESDEISTGRFLFDDIDDYHNWSASPPQDRFGNHLDQYGDLTRSVEVFFVAADNFQETSSANEGFKKVVITVHRNDQILTSQKYIIPGVRLTNYGRDYTPPAFGP